MDVKSGSSKRIILHGYESTDDELGYDSSAEDVELDGSFYLLSF